MFFLITVVIPLILGTFVGWKIAESSRLKKERQKEKLKLLREFTGHSSKITQWLKDHKEELRKHPIATLNDREFVALIDRDQELYERVLEADPDYPDIVMPPKELYQYFTELAQGQHKQTH